MIKRVGQTGRENGHEENKHADLLADAFLKLV